MKTTICRSLPLLTSLLCMAALPALAQTVTFVDPGEKFAGPFPSWKNGKTDYGAKGDGVTDAKLFRVQITGGNDKDGIRIEAGNRNTDLR